MIPSTSKSLLRLEMISIMVIEEIKIGSLDSTKILETAVEPFSGWYLLKRELVSIKKDMS